MLFICLNLYADYASVRQDSFLLQAGYGRVANMTITEIPAQTTSYISGMPFDIEEALVQYNSSYSQGRTIAYFNIISNTDFSVKVYGEPMRHLTEEGTFDVSTGAPELHYILYFECQLGYYNNGEIQTTTSSNFTFRSRNSDYVNGTTVWEPDFSMKDDNSFVGNVEGQIHFMFDSDTTSFISSANDTTLPRGTYGANVVIEIVPSDGDSRSIL